MEKIKVAVVGTGSICRSAHMPVYMKRDDVEVIACADIDFEKAKAFAEKFNIPAIATFLNKKVAFLRKFRHVTQRSGQPCATREIGHRLRRTAHRNRPFRQDGHRHPCRTVVHVDRHR